MQDVTERDKTRGTKAGERKKQTKIQKNNYELITISFNLYSLGLQFKLKILKILLGQLILIHVSGEDCNQHHRNSY